MADPLVNAQFAQSLFAALPAMIRRRNEQQANIAFTSLQRRWQEDDAARKRSQQLADQETQFRNQAALTNLTTDRYIEMERERSRRQEDRDEAVSNRQLQSDLRRAYAAYATLAADVGETPKPLGEFGRTDQAISGLDQEMARLRDKQNDAAFQGVVAGYNQRFNALRAMSQPAPEDVRGITQRILGEFAWTDTDEKNRAKVVDAFERGAEKVALSLLGPQDRAAFIGQRAQGLQSLQVLRMKDPSYVAATRELATMHEELVKASFKNPKWAKMLGQVGGGATAGAGRLATPEDFAALGGGNGKGKEAPKPAPASAPAPTPGLMDQLDEGGIPATLPTLRRLVSLIPRVASGGLIDAQAYMRDNVQYLPGTLNYMAGYATGGKRGAALRLEQGDRERAAEAALLRQFSAPWVKTTGDAVLRSILGPATTSP